MGEVTDGDRRRGAVPHVIVDDLASPVLSHDDDRHLRRSLRVRDGDRLTLTDGNGGWCQATLTAGGVEPSGPVSVEPALRPKLSLVISLTKGTKPELAVQKAVELGIDEIVVCHAERSVAVWGEDKRTRNTARLVRVAREAAMQSRAVRVPLVRVVDGLAQAAEAVGRVPVRADFGGAVLTAEHTCVAIGPEGGWSDGERVDWPDAVDLGPTVLRAETAAISAAVQMAALRRAQG